MDKTFYILQYRGSKLMPDFGRSIGRSGEQHMIFDEIEAARLEAARWFHEPGYQIEIWEVKFSECKKVETI